MHRKIAIRALVLVGAAVIAVSSLSSRALAQSGDVVAAQYGANRTWVDVTNQVRSMAQNGSLNFRVSTGVFGISDPVPNVVKTLRLRVRQYNGALRDYQYQENQTVSLQVGGNPGNPPNRPPVGAYPGPAYRLRDDDQRRFDSYYTRWLDYQRTNNRSEVRSMEKRMRDIYSDYSIPNNTPFAQIASPGIGQPTGGGPGWGYNDLRVTSARYGAGYQTADVTGRLQQMINNGTLSLRVNNDSMGGDPAPNQRKQLYVQYFYQGQQRNVTVFEGNDLRIP